MQKIKIVHILYSGQGGLGTYFMNFVNSDKKNKFHHHALFYGIEPLNKELEDFCLAQGIPYTYIEHVSKFDSKAIKKAIHFIECNQIKWVMLHTFSLSLLTIIGLFKKWKVIAVDHTTIAFKTRIEKLFSAINHVLASKMIYFYEGHFEQNKRIFPFLRFGKNSHIIPKTVDVHFFKPREVSADNLKFTLGITSRLIQGKKHDLIIAAIAKLRDANINVHLKIAGEGPRQRELKEMVIKLNLEKHIQFTGLLNRNQLLEFYRLLDAYIHASEGETICYSIMEAQACALPILASDKEGINNFVTDKKNGLLFDNNTDSIVKIIRIIVSDFDLYKELSQASRTSAKKNFLKYNNAEMLNNIIKE